MNVISPVLPPVGAAVHVQVPVPIKAVLPPNPALVLPWQVLRLPPLVEVVGGALTTILASAVEEVQGKLLIVHLTT